MWASEIAVKILGMKIPDALRLLLYGVIIGGFFIWGTLTARQVRKDDLRMIYQNLKATNDRIEAVQRADSIRYFFFDSIQHARMRQIDARFDKLYGVHYWPYQDIEQ